MPHARRIIAPTIAALVAAGCLPARRASYQSVERVDIAVPSERADVLWTSIQQTLREHRFRLDRADRRAGVVTTLPELSQHFFEFWRNDVNTREDFWAATLNPIRRWVEVHVAGESENSWNTVEVIVHKERLSSPDRQFNSTGAAYQYFATNLPSTEGVAIVPAEDDIWLDLGRDNAMEESLLNQILARAGSAVPAVLPPEDPG